jgi:uncharacterized membrane protein
MAIFSKIAMYLMAAFFTYAGVSHFKSPKFFLKIMPPYIPAHEFMVAASGVAEIVLGLGLLFPQTRMWAAWGIIALLIVVFPANVYMAYGERFQAMSPWIRWGRLPLQAVLIWWAYQYTK